MRLPHRPSPNPETGMAVQVHHKPLVVRRGCVTADGSLKRVWRTKREAKAWLRNHIGTNYRQSNDWGHMNLYRCKHCDGWHCGHDLEGPR